MIRQRYFGSSWTLPVLAGMCLLLLLAMTSPVGAITQIPTPDPQPGSYGLEATKPKDPPTVGARITVPGNGASFSASPITVSGICPPDLLVQLYNNGVMVGSVMCKNRSFSLRVSLFAGKNELYALVYDDLGQAGPKSNTVTITYNDTRFEAFGELITLTSSYGRRSAPIQRQLSWPLQLSGGTGPYAFSIDWGDGSEADLKSQSLAGLLTIAHVYKKAGISQVNIKVTDKNGVSAFLQVIAVANGQVEEEKVESEKTGTRTVVIWIPTVIAVLLLVPAFWLGRRSQIVSLRNKMLKERDTVEPK